MGYKFLLTRPLRDVTTDNQGRIHFKEFLLTRPLRDVTSYLQTVETVDPISTHTPLAGRDIVVIPATHQNKAFLLTRPLRDVTKVSPGFPGTYAISTHTPLAGRDTTF